MPRRHRRKPTSLPPLPSDGAVFYGTERQPGPGWDREETYLVRRVGRDRAKKYYLCPGCNQNIVPGERHVVAWPETAGHRGEDRRHWHASCWDRR